MKEGEKVRKEGKGRANSGVFRTLQMDPKVSDVATPRRTLQLRKEGRKDYRWSLQDTLRTLSMGPIESD